MPQQASETLFSQELLDENPIIAKRFYMPIGQNSKDQPDAIGLDQVATLQNADTNARGVRVTRTGFTQVSNDTGTSLRVPGLGNFYVGGGTKYLTRVNGTLWESWAGAGNWTTITGATLTNNKITNFVVAGGMQFLLNGIDNVFSTTNGTAATDEGNTNTDPPHSRFGIYHQNMLILSGNSTSRSYVWPSVQLDPQTFDRNARAIQIDEKDNDDVTALVNLSLTLRPGFLAFKTRSTHFVDTSEGGDDPSLWTIIKIDSAHGTIGERTACAVGASVGSGDCVFLSQEGRKYRLRSLVRSINDSITTGSILSTSIENILDDVNDTIMDQCIVYYFDERILLAIPSGNHAYLDTLCVLDLKNSDPSSGSWKWSVWTGFKIASISTYRQNGIDYLYFGDGTANAKVYRMFDGSTSDDGVAIDFIEESRRENFDTPELDKNFQFVECEFLATDDSYVTVEAQIDGDGYSSLNPVRVQLENAGPHLPINLPFQLAAQNKVRQKFQMDALGIGRDIQIKITHGEIDKKINLLGYTIVAFVEPLHLETRSQT